MVNLTQLIFGAPHKIKYTNWKGETEVRKLEPLSLYFGTTEHHTEPQWLVSCYDIDRKHVRHYSLDKMEIL